MKGNYSFQTFIRRRNFSEEIINFPYHAKIGRLICRYWYKENNVNEIYKNFMNKLYLRVPSGDMLLKGVARTENIG